MDEARIQGMNQRERRANENAEEREDRLSRRRERERASCYPVQ